jgi:hypothetical protein
MAARIGKRHGADFRCTWCAEHPFGLMLIPAAISHVYLWPQYL